MARVLIVGAGITGLLTALRCASDGHSVVVLDRGPIPNPGSTSFVRQRALRSLDPTDAAATEAAAGAQRAWVDLRGILGDQVFRRVGVVTALPASGVDRAHEIALGAGLRTATVERSALGPVRVPAGTVPVLELDGGVLLADRVLRAAVRWLIRHPMVELRPWQPVVDVDGDAPAVTTARGEHISGDVLLVAAGPWSGDLVPVPTVLHRQTVVYLRPPADWAPWWNTAPCVGRAGLDGRSWLIPPGEGTLLKISTANACREVDALDGTADDPTSDIWADLVLATGVLTDPDRYRVEKVETCHYAVDAHSRTGALTRTGRAAWARAASGGDGFRTAPLIADHITTALSAVPA